MQGTSMASPLVAGVVALLKAAEPGATDEQIREALADSAIDLGATGRDEQFGYGLINPLGAYAALTDSTPPPPQPGYRVRIRAPDYPDSFLESDGIFTLMNAPMGLLTVTAESDDNGNGVYGEPGEYRGAATIDVRFNQPNTVNIYMSR
jgi:subtilisin family serine protease